MVHSPAQLVAILLIFGLLSPLSAQSHAQWSLTDPLPSDQWTHGEQTPLMDFDSRPGPRGRVHPFFNRLSDGAGDENPLLIPEPMLFDLVRPLGARRGELEINTLAVFPWRAINRDPDRDPFGSGQTTPDRGEIEWAPEIEYAFADGWAIEFELPYEGSKLEAYKVALQGTFGTALDGRYIHGFQTIVEPTTEWKDWNSTLLYLGGLRFDEQWSVLFMVGARMNLSGRGNAATFERLTNATLFREINDRLTLGLEVNNAEGFEGRSQTIFVPQSHFELSEHWELQSGVGLGVFDQGSEQSAIIRVIWSR